MKHTCVALPRRRRVELADRKISGSAQPFHAAKEMSLQDAEAFLERFHLMADRGLRHVQLLGGMRETGVTGGRLERAQRIQRQLRTAHLRQRVHSFSMSPPSFDPLRTRQAYNKLGQ